MTECSRCLVELDPTGGPTTHVAATRYLADAKHAAEAWVRQHAQATETPASADFPAATAEPRHLDPAHRQRQHSAPNGAGT